MVSEIDNPARGFASCQECVMQTLFSPWSETAMLIVLSGVQTLKPGVQTLKPGVEEAKPGVGVKKHRATVSPKYTQSRSRANKI